MILFLSVPRLIPEINKETNNVDLKTADSNKPLPSVCLQYERNGICRVGVISA